MGFREIATEVGRGMAAGLAGTAVMTASQQVEMKIEDREPSMVPAKAVEKTFDLEIDSEKAEVRLNNATHWVYGTLWGGARGLLGAFGLSGPTATAAHFALIYGTALVMLPAMDLAEPPTKWSKKQIGLDLLQHAIYAAATSAAYEGLRRTGNGANGFDVRGDR